MSLSVVRPFFRARMLALGFTEWRDAFNLENIPSTKIDRAFHIETNQGTAVKQNQQDQELSVSVTIRFFRKGFRTPADALDQGLLHVEQIFGEVLVAPRRVSTVGIKNIVASGFSFQPLDESNDNTILGVVEFTALVILDV